MLNKQNFIQLGLCTLILLIPLFHVISFGRYGIEDSDSGFIVGLGWRIINGEIPYLDFYYVRPPVSIFLSAFYQWLLPDAGEILWMRFINYYQLLLQVILTYLILKKNYSFETLNINKYAFIFISYALTSVGTLYFQWHTTDAIFFSVVSIFLVVHYSNAATLIIAGFICGLAALSKQNFLLIPLFLSCYILYKYGYKNLFFYAAGFLTSIASFFIYLIESKGLDRYLDQTTNTGSVIDIVKSGFLYYIYLSVSITTIVIVIISVITSTITFKYKNKVSGDSKSKVSFFIFINLTLIFIANSFHIFWKKETNLLVHFDNLIPVVLTLSFIALLIRKREQVKEHYVLVLLLLVSWCSSISWGAPSPIMYFSPVVFLSLYLLSRYTIVLKLFSLPLALVILVYSFLDHSIPYRDSPITQITRDGGQISDKLKYIKVNQEFYNKHSELSSILAKYPNSTILPSMPGAYYIHSEINRLSIDWAMDAEIAFENDKLKKEIAECCNVILMEKRSIGQPIGTGGYFFSSVSQHVLDNFELITDEYEYFDIYRPRE